MSLTPRDLAELADKTPEEADEFFVALSPTPPLKIALVEASGITSLVCFALGYGQWAWHL